MQARRSGKFWTLKRRRLALGLSGLWWLGAGSAATVDPQTYLNGVRFLASQEMRGRGTGSPELEKAATYIARKFHEFGLKPIDGKSYEQAFEVTANAHLGRANHFTVSAGGHETTLQRDDFIPFNFSAPGSFAGRVVFVGYGITAPEYGYDDYAGIDVKGKVVLLLRHEPQEHDEKSVFAGRVYTQHAQFSSKANNARMHGAAAVVLIADRANHRSESGELEPFGSSMGPADAGIPFVQMKAGCADAWFKAAGKSLDTIEEEIDKDLRPRSFAFPPAVRVAARVDIVRTVKTVHNVAGYLPGTGSEYVVVGAHYDHLGLGEQFSMAPSLAGTVHPGADDNASGTAGVIELARWFAHQPRQRRGILFLTFAGEELGLLGSAYFVMHPSFPLEKAVAMINLDMIGRIREGKVYVGGVGTGTNLRPILDRITPKYGLNLDYSDTTGYGSSDHVSFTTREVPVLFFFSGLHEDYHRPSDTWDKIDAPGTAKLLELVAEVTGTLRETGERPLFVRLAPPSGAAGPVGSAAGTESGPYSGFIPDSGEGTQGVKVAAVQAASPAATAGFQAGDVMLQFDGKAVRDLNGFTCALHAKRPGDVVTVKVLRQGVQIEAQVVLTKPQ
jgi:hypothetical protein